MEQLVYILTQCVAGQLVFVPHHLKRLEEAEALGDAGVPLLLQLL